MRTPVLVALAATFLSLAGCNPESGQAGKTGDKGTKPGAEEDSTKKQPDPDAEDSPSRPDGETERPKLTAEVVQKKVRELVGAYNSHDAKKVASLFTDDAVVIAYGDFEGRGPGAAEKRHRQLFDAFEDIKFGTSRAWITDNVAIMEVAWTGTHTGEIYGIQASRKPAGSTRVHIAWFADDGKIKEIHEYGEGAHVIGQVTGKYTAPPVPTLQREGQVVVAKGSPEEKKLADWAKNTDRVFSGGDVAAVVELSASDAVPCTAMPCAGLLEALGDDVWTKESVACYNGGAEMVAGGLGEWFKAFPDQKWTPTNVWGVGDFAIIEHTMSATQKAPHGVLAASDKAFQDWHFVDVLQSTADGKIQKAWGYGNSVELASLTGAKI